MDKSKGENLLTIDSKDSRNEPESGKEFYADGKAGNTAIVHDSGTDQISFLHESLHFLGFEDRYTKDDNNNWSIGIPSYKDNKGFENDIMGANQENRRDHKNPLVAENHYNQLYKAYLYTTKHGKYSPQARIDDFK